MQLCNYLILQPDQSGRHGSIRAYFLIQKSVGWTFDTLELPPAQTLMRMAALAAILFKISGRLQNRPYGPAFYLPGPVKIQVLLVCRTD